MKIENAIMQLQSADSYHRQDEYKLSDDAIEMSITALEKQIPMEMTHSNERIPFSWFCPRCNQELSDDGYKYDNNYCPYCGQEIKQDEQTNVVEFPSGDRP